MWEFLTNLTTQLFNKEVYMAFFAGLVVGVIIGGLVGVFVTPMFWKPKQ